MINLEIHTTTIFGLCYEPITVGCMNSIFIQCRFAPEWEPLTRVAVFSNGSVSVAVPMEEDCCAIPHEVLAAPGKLTVAFRGIGDGGNVVLCTQDKYLGKVVPSSAGELPLEAEEATPDVLDALLADVAELKAGGGGTGTAGKSAYEIAQDNGFDGTEQEWLASLCGADGQNGADGQDGEDGIDGRDGADGADGADGYTPVKGVDYFTDADIAEITSAVLDALPDGDEVSY